MPELELRNIDKFYGDVHAVRDVSLKVAAGEFVVLVGPSGCGKSTLLRSIAGLEDISGGDIVLDGRSIVDLPPRDRNIAMVFQSYALYPYLSVYENIAFGLRARKIKASIIEERVGWASELLRIEEFLNRFPRELSGGQRQRVAIGRAIVREADLFLFDEPLSNLDAKLRDGMREEIKRLHRKLGKTFIYVTHDQVEAMTLAERIVLLNGGVVEQEGTPLDVFERPGNIFVGGFLGSPAMNFIEVEVSHGGRQLVLPNGDVISLNAPVREGQRHGDGKLVWGIRPEHFSIGSGDGHAVAATIEVIQPTGSRIFVSFSVAGTHLVAELDAKTRIVVDQQLSLSIDISRTSFFDPVSGRSVRGN